LIFIFQCILFFFKHKKDFSNTTQIK
jgi:hypothetical protein